MLARLPPPVSDPQERMNRDRFRTQARPTARARRIAEAARRDDELRRRGIDPEAYERARLEQAGGRSTPREARPRRRRSIGAIVRLALLAVLIGLIVGGVLLFGRINAFNNAVSSSGTLSSALFGPLNGQDRVNVLMVGYAGGDHPGAYLADSVNIYSVDPRTNTTTVIPIPRDFWVEGFPDVLPDNGKINEVFAVGVDRGGLAEGARALAHILSEVTGLEIQHWLAIDFAGFREMVDAVGGVTIQNPRAFSYTTSESNYHAGIWDRGTFEAGTLALDGTRALDYTRARYTSDPAESSDFARSVRQQRVLGALRDKLGSGGIGAIGPGLGLMDAMQGRMKTDLSALDLGLLSSHLAADRRIELSEDVILQATTNTIGQYILVVIGRASPTDYQPLRTFIADRLAEPIASSSPSPGG
jgi:LCP family protein required for cell wall assembly